MSESEYLYKGPCADCGSSDACAVYTDGHTHCFACSKTNQNGATPGDAPKLSGKRAVGLLSGLSYIALPARQINEETARKFGYGVTRYNNLPCQVAPYYDEDGNLVGQKVRLPGKDFKFFGDMKRSMPFGSHAFPRTGKTIVVTEGEIDAMTMAQVQGLKWPVVSIACGADKPFNDDGEPLPMTKIRKYFGQHREYFMGFEKVVIMFDSDEQGVASAKVAAEVIGPTAHIAVLPMKDPNDMLLAGRVGELVNAMFRAKKHQPDGIVALADIADRVCKDVVRGADWSHPRLTELTYGRRNGEVWVLGAGPGAGKTDFLLQEAEYTVTVQKEPVGLFFLESGLDDVALRMAGKLSGKCFHVPDDGWTVEERDAAVHQLAETNRVFLYDNFGMTEWDSVSSRIRHLCNVEGVRYFVVDNLTSFLTGADDERREADRIVLESSMLAKELGVFIWLVSHLATPEGKPHEEGGQIMLRHLKGSRGIGAGAHYAIGLERNQQATDEEERRTTTVRILKDRYTGRATGKTFQVRYEESTGRLSEVGYSVPQDNDRMFPETDETPQDF